MVVRLDDGFFSWMKASFTRDDGWDGAKAAQSWRFGSNQQVNREVLQAGTASGVAYTALLRHDIDVQWDGLLDGG